jgi:hypothetical protein
MKKIVLSAFILCLLATPVRAQAAVGYNLGLFAPGSVVGGSTTAVPIRTVRYNADTTGASTMAAVNASTVICGITMPAGWPAPADGGGTITLTLTSMGRVIIGWGDVSNLPTSASKICALDIGPSLDTWKAGLAAAYPTGQIIPWSIQVVDTAGYLSPWAPNGVPAFFSSAPPPAVNNLIVISHG